MKKLVFLMLLALTMLVTIPISSVLASGTESFSTTFVENGCAIEVKVPFLGPLGSEDKEWDLKFSVVIRDPQNPGRLKLLDQIYTSRFIKKEGGFLFYKHKLPVNEPFWARYWGERENFSCSDISESDRWLYIDQSSKYNRVSCNGSPGYEQVIFPAEQKIEIVRPEWNAPCRP